ncbi:MAG TPA: glycosyl hydrolase family 18 protein [Candidatus Limnocylindrales bacterium]|nr:glycosyl hydrolase family 18 protein [Candidatus Limnocylindrales bacterium]
MTRRPVVAGVLTSLAVTISLVLGPSRPPAGDPPVPDPAAPGASAAASGRPAVDRIPIPGHEVYGYVPYWEMDEGIADHLAATHLTTLGLFSVTHGGNGAIAKNQNGYRRITGDIGRRMIGEARDRGVRVELVYTSFGAAKNDAFFSRPTVQDRTIEELVALASEIGVDGINVDVEVLAAEHVPAYGEFVERLGDAWGAAHAGGRVSVATTANARGAAMAVAAATAGAHRVFLMGYDYHWSGSGPGASAPLDRRDGSEKDLPWSLDLYRLAGVPVERTLLGLPLYGMSWEAEGPEPGAPASSRGTVWIPRHNLADLAHPTAAPEFDPLEGVEVLALPEGDAWRTVYFDSPDTLAPKLRLADDRGLAGAGFWAIGYERGLPEYTALIARFGAGELESAAIDP